MLIKSLFLTTAPSLRRALTKNWSTPMDDTPRCGSDKCRQNAPLRKLVLLVGRHKSSLERRILVASRSRQMDIRMDTLVLTPRLSFQAAPGTTPRPALRGRTRPALAALTPSRSTVLTTIRITLITRITHTIRIAHITLTDHIILMIRTILDDTDSSSQNLYECGKGMNLATYASLLAKAISHQPQQHTTTHRHHFSLIPNLRTFKLYRTFSFTNTTRLGPFMTQL